MKLDVLNYNKEEARFKFTIFKVLELLGVFLFVWGFESLGRWSYHNLPFKFISGFIPSSYLEYWMYGFLTLLVLVACLSGISVALCLVYQMIKSWIKLNWRWAKILSEEEDSRTERLSEQNKLSEIKEIEKLERDRKKFGYCKGDIAVRESEGTFGRVGDKLIIKHINSSRSFDAEGHEFISIEEFRIVNKKLPKKPKLNKVREKEVREKK